MKMNEGINRDPEIFSGEPVFAGTRVPVKFLIDYLKRGETILEFLDIHEGVSCEQVCSLLDMAYSALVGERPTGS